MADLWMPGAIKVPGHPDKVGYTAFGTRGPKRGDVKHSAEGWATYLKFLIETALAIKSWTFTTLLSGTIWQHYPIDAHCWHAGDTDDDDDVRANIELVGIEHEGLVGTPLTAEQTQATVAITKFCAEYFERSAAYARFPVQPSDGWTLVEHTQVSNTYTACPSDRIPWDDILELLTVEEDDMFARIIRKEGETRYRTYLWRPGHTLLHMKNKQMHDDTVALYGLKGEPIPIVGKDTLEAL